MRGGLHFESVFATPGFPARHRRARRSPTTRSRGLGGRRRAARDDRRHAASPRTTTRSSTAISRPQVVRRRPGEPGAQVDALGHQPEPMKGGITMKHCGYLLVAALVALVWAAPRVGLVLLLPPDVADELDVRVLSTTSGYWTGYIRAGSGSGTDACQHNNWIPLGDYDVLWHDDNYPGSKIQGRVWRLSDYQCSNGVRRTELFVHSEETSGQGQSCGPSGTDYPFCWEGDHDYYSLRLHQGRAAARRRRTCGRSTASSTRTARRRICSSTRDGSQCGAASARRGSARLCLRGASAAARLHWSPQSARSSGDRALPCGGRGRKFESCRAHLREPAY